MPAFELLGMHDQGDVVAFGGAGSKTVADLLSDAARISLALPRTTRLDATSEGTRDDLPKILVAKRLDGDGLALC